MAHFRGTNSAFGAPGDEARWTGAAKDGVGTAHSFGGRVWLPLAKVSPVQYRVCSKAWASLIKSNARVYPSMGIGNAWLARTA
jgi:hypothetical protein